MSNPLTRSKQISSYSGLNSCCKMPADDLQAQRCSQCSAPAHPPKQPQSFAQRAYNPALISCLPGWGLPISSCLAKELKEKQTLVLTSMTLLLPATDLPSSAWCPELRMTPGAVFKHKPPPSLPFTPFLFQLQLLLASLAVHHFKEPQSLLKNVFPQQAERWNLPPFQLFSILKQRNEKQLCS